MHLKGTDLNFQGLAAGAQNRGMQGLVHIGFGHSHVVLEAARNGTPHAVHNAQGTIAILDRVHQHANGQQIIDFTELLVVTEHLFVNAVEVFRTALDFTANTSLFHCILQRFHGLVNHGLTLTAFGFYLLHQIIVYVRLHITEGQIL